MELRFPEPLRRGSTIAVTSPSAGVAGAGAARVDFCVGWLRERGYAVADALGMLDLPVVLDLEIGHVPPHLPLLNGATARIVVDGQHQEIAQAWP